MEESESRSNPHEHRLTQVESRVDSMSDAIDAIRDVQAEQGRSIAHIAKAVDQMAAASTASRGMFKVETVLPIIVAGATLWMAITAMQLTPISNAIIDLRTATDSRFNLLRSDFSEFQKEGSPSLQRKIVAIEKDVYYHDLLTKKEQEKQDALTTLTQKQLDFTLQNGTPAMRERLTAIETALKQREQGGKP